MRNRYPHITSLYHNAGFAAASGVAYLKFAKQIMVEGWAYAVAHPNFNIEHPGLMTADGERGMVWNINTLAPYIIVRDVSSNVAYADQCSSQTKELAPLLRQSPESLPVQPRVIYTSSTTAVYEKLKPKPLDDYQLLSYGVDTSTSVYSASKYMGDLAMIQLDREFSEESTDRPIRCCIAQPGIVFTNLFNSGLGKWRWVQTIKWYIAWFSLLIVSRSRSIWLHLAGLTSPRLDSSLALRGTPLGRLKVHYPCYTVRSSATVTSYPRRRYPRQSSR